MWSILTPPWRSVLFIILGSAIYAFGIHYFIVPHELMEGGVTGLSLILYYALGLPPSVTTLLINIALFLVGWKILGGRPMVLTIVGTLSLSLFLWLMETAIYRGWIVPFASDDYFLITLYAGVTLGVGLGIVFRNGGTTGGVDIIARLGSKLKGWSMGRVILAFDAAVIASSLFYIPPVKLLYTLVIVFISSRVIDFIVEGAYAAKAFVIISSRATEIADVISRELDRGATIIPAKGAYSQAPREMLYCIVYRHQTHRLRSLVKAVDPNAFMVISDVHDVLGEGFRQE